MGVGSAAREKKVTLFRFSLEFIFRTNICARLKLNRTEQSGTEVRVATAWLVTYLLTRKKQAAREKIDDKRNEE